jgi:hypothetical protein
LDVWEEAEKYYNCEITHCVKYENYLVNHTQKLAIDMALKKGFSIDLIHKITELDIETIKKLNQKEGIALVTLKKQ